MKLAAWLEEAKTTQDEFAKRIGTSQAAVARYANGVRIPRPERMAAIARETGGKVTAMDFYAGEQAGSPIAPAGVAA